MGIEGLLKLLGPVTVHEHISTFRDQTAAIDIMSWLYKGCYRCAYEHNQNIQTNQFLYYILEMLQILTFYNIKPIVVFDGRYVGKKNDTIDKRKKQKQENRQKGLQYLEKGMEEEARKYLSRCIIIDDRIITVTMKALFSKGIEFMVAPYESDSQIAKLVHLGVADFAITQDSDLLIYNARVVLKLSQDGECDFIDLSRWQPTDVDTAYLKIFLKMTPQQRIDAAVMAGSDYNSSIKGIGIKRAIKYLAEHQTVSKVIQVLKTHKRYGELIPEGYERKVLESKLIFIFATIYHPFNKCLQFLNPELLQEFKPQQLEIQDLKKLVGPFYGYDQQMKNGRVNVRSMQPREIERIALKDVFVTNANNLEIREKANINRRQFVAEQRRKRQEERAKMPEVDDADLWKKPSRPKKEKVIVPVVQLTEEEKKKDLEERKAQRAQRFSQFKSFLNNFTIEDSSDSESLSSSEAKENNISDEKLQPTPIKNNVTKTSVKTTPKEVYQDSNSESVDQFLMALNPCTNPWAKR